MEHIDETVENLRNIEYPDNLKDLDEKFKSAVSSTYKAVNELNDIIDSAIRINDGYVSYEYVRDSFFNVYEHAGIARRLGAVLDKKIHESIVNDQAYELMILDNFHYQLDVFEATIYSTFDRVSYIMGLPVDKDGTVHIDYTVQDLMTGK